MLLEHLVENIDNSKTNQYDIDSYNLEDLLQSEFSICLRLDHSKVNTRVSCYWLANWYCTDTWVGYKLYFLDNNLLALSYQESRKSDEDFTFANAEIKNDFKKYILSLAENYDENVETKESFLDLNEDMKEGIYISFPSELMAKQVFYNGDLCNVVFPKGINSKGEEYDQMYRYEYGKDNKHLTIELGDKSQISVHISDIQVPYNIKKEL